MLHLKQVLASIAKLSDKENQLKHIDPSIIGGFILRIGDKQYNVLLTDYKY
jgi:F-type H+-transporting ATPase subunit delta